MTDIKSNNSTLAHFDYFLIIGVVACSVGYAALTGEWDIIGMIAAIAGLINVVLCAKGSIINYLFGLINVSLYAYISFKSQLYGDFALNTLYYIPMQFIGFFSWRKRGNKGETNQVEGRRMTNKGRFLWGLLTVATTAIGAFILFKVGDPYPIKDAITTIVSVIAMLLMVKAYMEQWILWIVVNLVSVVIWLQFTINQEPHSALMLIMWLFYTANSINGYRVWLKLSK